jgi:hypothetical protein
MKSKGSADTRRVAWFGGPPDPSGVSLGNFGMICFIEKERRISYDNL